MKTFLAHKQPWGIAILAIVYAVGLTGFLITETRPLFQQLTLINLVFASAVVLLFHQNWTLKFVGAMAAIFVTGWFIELVGVYSILIFGEYQYGPTLGWGPLGIPLMIGVNWMILIYCTATIAHQATLPRWVQASIGAALMVLLDVVIEPFAIRFDLWEWWNNEIPLKNYLAWYIISWVMIYAILNYIKMERNYVAVALYACQLLFFTVLWWVLG